MGYRKNKPKPLINITIVNSERYQSESKRLRKLKPIIELRGWNCFYCSKKLNIRSASIEHLDPKALGGTNDLDNLHLSCVKCNSKAGHKPVNVKLRMRR